MRHHISIFPSNSKVKPTPPEQEASSPPPPPPEEHPRMGGHQPTNQNREQPQNTHVNMFVDAQSSILLQTARATIYNPKDPSNTSQARLIFEYLTVEAKLKVIHNFRNERQAEYIQGVPTCDSGLIRNNF
jgi:hypothetical protein